MVVVVIVVGSGGGGDGLAMPHSPSLVCAGSAMPHSLVCTGQEMFEDWVQQAVGHMRLYPSLSEG